VNKAPEPVGGSCAGLIFEPGARTAWHAHPFVQIFGHLMQAPPPGICPTGVPMLLYVLHLLRRRGADDGFGDGDAVDRLVVGNGIGRTALGGLGEGLERGA
jgi:hypothetical protein